MLSSRVFFNCVALLEIHGERNQPGHPDNLKCLEAMDFLREKPSHRRGVRRFVGATLRIC